MTVNVIEDGLADFKSFTCKCDSCGCKLEVTDVNDLKIGEFGSGMDESFNNETELYVNCPRCGNCVKSPGAQQKKYLNKLLALNKK